jgi:hypothetical protein
VKSQRPGFKKVQIQEDSDDSDDKEAVQKLKQDGKKTKTVDAKTLKGAQEKAIA